MYKKKTIRLTSEAADNLDLYVEATKETYEHCDESEIIEAMLNSHIKRDKKFKGWLKQKQKQAHLKIED